MGIYWHVLLVSNVPLSVGCETSANTKNSVGTEHSHAVRPVWQKLYTWVCSSNRQTDTFGVPTLALWLSGFGS